MDHDDGLALQYGNPANSAQTTSKIQLVRQHLVQMSQGTPIDATAALPAVACPASADGPAARMARKA